jgi:hypothetical protein
MGRWRRPMKAGRKGVWLNKIAKFWRPARSSCLWLQILHKLHSHLKRPHLPVSPWQMRGIGREYVLLICYKYIRIMSFKMSYNVALPKSCSPSQPSHKYFFSNRQNKKKSPPFNYFCPKLDPWPETEMSFGKILFPPSILKRIFQVLLRFYTLIVAIVLKSEAHSDR